MTDRRAFAFDAVLEMEPGTDTRAPGGAVTVALCGAWDHDGPCRWPHYSEIDTGSVPARLRTVVVTDDETAAEVITRIENALRSDPGWTVTSCEPGDIAPGERALAERLMNPRTPEEK